MENNYEKNVIKQCFTNEKALLYANTKIKSPDVFENDFCKFIFEAYNDIKNVNVNITKSSMKDYFDQTGNTQYYNQWERLISADYQDESEYKYQINQLVESYSRKFLVELCSVTEEHLLDNYPTDEIVNRLIQSVLEIRVSESPEISFNDATEALKNKIKENLNNEGSNYIRTGNIRFDNALKLQRDRSVLFAAQKKVGKSRFIIDLVDKIVGLNDNVRILFYSLEIDEAEMASFFISRSTGVYPDQMMSIHKKIDEQTLKRVDDAIVKFKDYPIEFVCGKVGISDIESQFTQFVKKYPNDIPILVIDNLGILKKHIDGEVEFYNDIALRLQHLKSETKSLQLLIHHLSKSSESHYNKDKLYEPGTKDIRSTSRLADYVSQVVLFHRYDKYDDVIAAHQDLKGKFLVKIAENRYGDESRILYSYDLGLSRFDETKL